MRTRYKANGDNEKMVFSAFPDFGGYLIFQYFAKAGASWPTSREMTSNHTHKRQTKD
jgi:hypothetical protein